MPATHTIATADARVRAALADPTSLASLLHAAHAPMRVHGFMGLPSSEQATIAFAIYAECERIEREHGGNRSDRIAYWQRQQVTATHAEA